MITSYATEGALDRCSTDRGDNPASCGSLCWHTIMLHLRLKPPRIGGNESAHHSSSNLYFLLFATIDLVVPVPFNIASTLTAAGLSRTLGFLPAHTRKQPRFGWDLPGGGSNKNKHHVRFLTVYLKILKLTEYTFTCLLANHKETKKWSKSREKAKSKNLKNSQVDEDDDNRR